MFLCGGAGRKRERKSDTISSCGFCPKKKTIFLTIFAKFHGNKGRARRKERGGKRKDTH